MALGGRGWGGEWVKYVSVVIAEIASNIIRLGKNRDLRSQWPRGLRWVCGYSLAGVAGSNPAGDTDVLSCLCCQEEVSASSWSLVQRSPAECGVS